MNADQVQREWRDVAERVEHGRGFSSWLRTALRQALARDPVDCASDAELLFAILRGRRNEVLIGDPMAEPTPTGD